MRTNLSIIAMLCILAGSTILWRAHQKELAHKDRVMVISTSIGPETRYQMFATAGTDAKEITAGTRLIEELEKAKRKARSAEEQPEVKPDHSRASIVLKWDASREPLVAGYKVWIGSVSGSYTSVTNVGNNTTFKVDNLTPGTTNYFNVTSYTAVGLESDFAGEIFYVAP